VPWFWLIVAPAVLLALLSLRGEQARAAYMSRRLTETYTDLPFASVIVPVKGSDEGLRENLAALAAQDYPEYELIVTARSAEDIPPGVLPARVLIVLAGGNPLTTSEKVLNLTAAVKGTRKRSQILAFADSDGRVSPGWLRALAGPLAEPGVGATTAYRWYTPESATFWPRLRSVWNAVIAGTLGPGDNRFVWGGAMAMRKETFFEAGVLEYWKGTVSDDYALAAAVHHAGLSIAYAPGATVACPDGTGGREFLGWVRRQMTITRVYSPALWWPALIAHIVYCGAMAAALAAAVRGERFAELGLAAVLVPGMVKGARRAALARTTLPQWKGWFDRHGYIHTLWVPVATWVWLYSLLASTLGNTIHWRGYRYRLRTPNWRKSAS
jgi:ceramide glucosyltransferase